MCHIAADRAVPRPHWLNARRARAYSAMVVAIFAVVAIPCVLMSLPDLVDPRGNAIGADLAAMWSAARLAVMGKAATAYDWAVVQALEHATVPVLPHVVMPPWVYSPTLLLVVMPLGLLPYPAAFAAFVCGTAAMWAMLVGRLFPDRRAWIVAAAAPAGLVNLVTAQNGFLTAAIAGFALFWLESRPLLAGVVIGLLSVKPHLAVLFPVALLAAARWHSIAAAAATVLVVNGASAAAFGWPVWTAFFDQLPTAVLVNTIDAAWHWVVIPTPFIFALSLGLPTAAAEALQVAAALCAAACVWRAWRDPAVPFEAKAAVLTAGSLLCSPYLAWYDLTWAALSVGWLALLGMRTGFRRGEREIMLLVWVLPLAMPLVYVATGAQIGFPVLALLLWGATRRAVAPAAESVEAADPAKKR